MLPNNFWNTKEIGVSAEQVENLSSSESVTTVEEVLFLQTA
jgi:hypothetical protein